MIIIFFCYDCCSVVVKVLLLNFFCGVVVGVLYAWCMTCGVMVLCGVVVYV